MRARALFTLSALALGAAACATVESPASPPSPQPTEGPAPAPVEGYDWILQIGGGTAHLTYGVPESDDLVLGLHCQDGSDRVGLVTLAEYGVEPVIVLESGGDVGRFPASAEVSELHDALILSAEAMRVEPVFQRFRRVGWLAQWRDGEREAYAPQPDSAPNIERFFAFCG